MTTAGDHPYEMRKHRPLSDRDVEDFFAGCDLPDGELLTTFAEMVRSSATRPAPVPTWALARILADGLTTDKGDLPVTAASNAIGPRPEASGLPKWRKPIVATSTFLTALFSKVGVAGAATKAALAAAATAGAVTAAGAAGVLPAPAQNALSHAVSAVTPINLPTDTVHGKPTNPGLNGLAKANSTPAAGHAPITLPAGAGQASQAGHATQAPDTGGQTSSTAQTSTAGTAGTTGAPASPGAQSATGLAQANSTPAAGHAPTSVPTPSAPGSQSTGHAAQSTQPASQTTSHGTQPTSQSTAGTRSTTAPTAAAPKPSTVSSQAAPTQSSGVATAVPTAATGRK